MRHSPVEELGEFFVEDLVCDFGAIFGKRVFQGFPPVVNRGDDVCGIGQRGHEVVERIHFVGKVHASQVDLDPENHRTINLTFDIYRVGQLYLSPVEGKC